MVDVLAKACWADIGEDYMLFGGDGYPMGYGEWDCCPGFDG